jgi:hypothetical protein
MPQTSGASCDFSSTPPVVFAGLVLGCFLILVAFWVFLTGKTGRNWLNWAELGLSWSFEWARHVLEFFSDNFDIVYVAQAFLSCAPNVR